MGSCTENWRKSVVPTPYLATRHGDVSGSRGVAPVTPNIGIRWRWVVNFTCRSRYAPFNASRYPLGGPKTRLDSDNRKSVSDRNKNPITTASCSWPGCCTDGATVRNDWILHVIHPSIHPFIHSFIGVCRKRWLLAVLIPLCYVLYPAILLPPHLPIYFLVYLSFLSFPYSCIVLFWKFYFLPFSVHVQTNVICLTALSLLQQVFWLFRIFLLYGEERHWIDPFFPYFTLRHVIISVPHPGILFLSHSQVFNWHKQ